MLIMSIKITSFINVTILDLIVVPYEMQLNVIQYVLVKSNFFYKRFEEILNQKFFIFNTSCKIDKIIADCVTCVL